MWKHVLNFILSGQTRIHWCTWMKMCLHVDKYEGASQEKENVSPSFYPQSALDDLGML